MTDFGMQVSVVPKEYVHAIWDKVAAFVESATERTNGRYSAEDVLSYIVDYDYLLWIAFDGEGIKGAVVTYFGSYPRKKTLNVMILGGAEGITWKEPMLKTLNNWARDNQCDSIEASGRMGWARVLKDNGFTPLWQTFEMPITPVELGA